MKHCEFLRLILVFATATLVSCGGGGENSASAPSTQNQSFTVGSDGGVIIDSRNDVSIEIAPNSTENSLSFSITQQISQPNVPLMGGRVVPIAGRVFEININRMSKLLKPALVTIPYDPAKVFDLSRLGVVYFDTTASKWISAELVSIDSVNSRVTFLTTHFSLWTSIYNEFVSFPATNFDYSIDTGFRPEIDGFSFNNALPAPYNSYPNFSFSRFRGNCTGMAGLATSLYRKNSPPSERLYAQSFRGADINNPDYLRVFEGVNKATGLIANAWWGLATLTTVRSLVSLQRLDLVSLLYESLWKENGPILVTFADLNSTNRHMVVVYRYRKNIDGTGDFFYYDPNFPGEQKMFSHLQNGFITPFDYSPDPALNGILLVDKIYVSPGVGSAITVDDVRGIFNENIACSSSANPSLCGSGFSPIDNPNLLIALVPHTGIETSQCIAEGNDALVMCNDSSAISFNREQDGMRSLVGSISYENFPNVSSGNFARTECVRDVVTGLLWEGKESGGLRQGAQTYTFYDDLRFGDVSSYIAFVNSVSLCGFSDWRLPDARELQSIVNYGTLRPSATITSTWFPNSQVGIYWAQKNSATGRPWGVDFTSGTVTSNLAPRGLYHVRLVRGERLNTPRYVELSLPYPGDETNNAVLDVRTNITWRRCSEGQSWSGGTCVGQASNFFFDNAMKHAERQIGWRLPNAKELFSIFTENADPRTPSLDQTAFPGFSFEIATSYFRSFIYWSTTPNLASNQPFTAYFSTASTIHIGEGNKGSEGRVLLIYQP